MKDFKNGLILLVIGAVLGGGSVGIYVQRTSIFGEEAKPLFKKEPAEIAKCDEIKVYSHSKKKVAKLPKEIQLDDTVYLADARVLPPSDHASTVSAALFPTEKRIKIYVAEEPYPWLKMGGGEKYVSLAYGPKIRDQLGQEESEQDVEMISRISFGVDNIRLKALKLGLRADVDTDKELFVAATIKYSWW